MAGAPRDLKELSDAMRRDWDERAARDAERFVYTLDGTSEPVEFDESGRLNYQQEIARYLPLLLDDRPASACRIVEIGCGIGRMTRWLAENSQEVHAVDVSPGMIEQARARLGSRYPNIVFHAGSGVDLAGLPDAYFDLAFSFIVFQHIPSREAIAQYIRETERVLKPGGAFRFQVNGWQDPDFRRTDKDTWLGESFSFSEIQSVLARSGLRLLSAKDAGTQYFFVTARKPRSRPAGDQAVREEADRQAWLHAVQDELKRLEQAVRHAPKREAITRLEEEVEKLRAQVVELVEELAGLRHRNAELSHRNAELEALATALDQSKRDLAGANAALLKVSEAAEEAKRNRDEAVTALDLATAQVEQAGVVRQQLEQQVTELRARQASERAEAECARAELDRLVRLPFHRWIAEWFRRR